MDTLPSVRTDETYTGRLLELNGREDIPLDWRGTPIESLIMSQNFHWPIQGSGNPELLISTCMEFRYALPIPRMYAYVIRRAGGRLIGSEFSIGYVLTKGIQHLAMIGHNDCGMTKVCEAASKMVDAFVNQGWKREIAQQYVDKNKQRYSMQDELDGLEQEFVRLKGIFPKLMIAPLFTCLFDNRLYLPQWYKDKYIDHRPAISYVVKDEDLRQIFS